MGKWGPDCSPLHFCVSSAAFEEMVKKISLMAKLVFGLNQSLDGYVDHDHAAFVPDPVLFRHFIDHVRGLTGSVYELMRYWDEAERDQLDVRTSIVTAISLTDC